MSAREATEAVAAAPLDLHAAAPADHARRVGAWRTILRTAEGRIGLGLGLVVLFVIVAGPFLAPYDPNEIAAGRPLTGPSASHLLGTDQLGRDVLSRFLVGGRLLLLVPLAAVTLAFALGGGLGLLAGYRRDWLDAGTARAFDLLLALPPLLLTLVIIAGAGTSKTILVLTVALVFAPRIGRVVRGATQSVVTHDYIAAAQARGERTPQILVREVMPNAAAPLLAEFALRLTYAILFVASLNFLGLGVQPPNADWGLMIADGRGFISVNPWATFAPALGIAALSVSFNLLSDATTRYVTRDAGRQSLEG